MIDNEQFVEIVILLIIDSFLFVFNLIGNIAVILCYLLSKECRTIVGMLLLHLAFCDIFAVFRLFQDSLDIVLNEWYPSEDSFSARDWLCTIASSASLFGFYGQSLTLCGIAINRYLRITQAQLYCKYIDRKAHIWTLVLVWLFAVIFHVENYFSVGPPLVTNGTSSVFGVSFNYVVCTTAASIATSLIPLVTLFVTTSYCYGAIFVYFIKSHRAVAAASSKGALLPSLWEK